MIRWIVDGRLATAAGNERPATGDTLIDVRDLVDRAGNSRDTLVGRVREGADALQRGETVVVMCDFGISRSNAIAAAILARWRSMEFDAAVAEVMARTGETAIKLDMVAGLRDAVSGAHAAPDRGTVLVTGGSGFIGRGLCPLLTSSGTGLAPSRRELDLLGSAVDHDGYCRRHRIGQIVHLAFPRVYTSNSALGASLTMLRNVLDVGRVLGLRLVLVSNSAVFSGIKTEMMIVDSTKPMHPRGVYGEAKFLQEKLVEFALQNGEVDAVVARLAPTYGPGCERPRLIRAFYEAILEGRQIRTHRYLDNALPRLDLLYVDDAVAGLAKLVRSNASGVHHFSTGSTYTPADVARRIAALVGRPVEITETPIVDHVANVQLDSTETRRLLGWEPRVDIDEGLRRTLDLPPRMDRDTAC
jgi:UDP-glucuronate decarboxylase